MAKGKVGRPKGSGKPIGPYFVCGVCGKGTRSLKKEPRCCGKRMKKLGSPAKGKSWKDSAKHKAYMKSKKAAASKGKSKKAKA